MDNDEYQMNVVCAVMRNASDNWNPQELAQHAWAVSEEIMRLRRESVMPAQMSHDLTSEEVFNAHFAESVRFLHPDPAFDLRGGELGKLDADFRLNPQPGDHDSKDVTGDRDDGPF